MYVRNVCFSQKKKKPREALKISGLARSFYASSKPDLNRRPLHYETIEKSRILEACPHGCHTGCHTPHWSLSGAYHNTGSSALQAAKFFFIKICPSRICREGHTKGVIYDHLTGSGRDAATLQYRPPSPFREGAGRSRERRAGKKTEVPDYLSLFLIFFFSYSSSSRILFTSSW